MTIQTPIKKREHYIESESTPSVPIVVSEEQNISSDKSLSELAIPYHLDE